VISERRTRGRTVWHVRRYKGPQCIAGKSCRHQDCPMRGEPSDNLYHSISGVSFRQQTCPSPGRDGGVSRVDWGSTGGWGGRLVGEQELFSSQFEAGVRQGNPRDWGQAICQMEGDGW